MTIIEQNNEDFANSFGELELTKHFSGVTLPKITIDEEIYKSIKLPNTSSNVQVLKQLCNNSFKELIKNGKIAKEDTEKYASRAKQELEILEKLHFCDYILIVWDVIHFCIKSNIPIGLGRGSVGGSLVCYLLSITSVDPIKYDLLFERFISPSRSKYHEKDGEIYLTGSIPDIDMDIDYLRRHEVVEYLAKKYPNRTAKILNLTTLTGKNLIKECGKLVYEKTESEMHVISEMVPVIFGKVSDIEDVYDENKQFKVWCDENPKAYGIALKLRGLIKNKSVHASGLAVSKNELTDSCPVEYSSSGNELVCSFNMNDIGDFMIKLDLLGLKTLSMIDDVCKQVNIKMSDIDYTDPDIYKFISNTDNFYGLFQLEAPTALSTTKRVKPDNLNDLAAVMALARPGAMNLIDKYAEAKRTGEIEKIHPIFDNILKDNNGLILYQENLMHLISAIGFTLEQGYQIIKIIGKKKTEEVAEWEQKIYDMAKKNGFDDNLAKLIFKSLKSSADYSFNKCLWEMEHVTKENGKLVRLRDIKVGDKIKCFNTIGKFDRYFAIKNKYKNKKLCYLTRFGPSFSIISSIDHKFLTRSGQLPLHVILTNNYEVLTSDGWQYIESIERMGIKNTVDLEIDSGDHNFYCNEIVVSNSHACCYGALAGISIFLKYQYPKEFLLACLKLSKHEQNTFECITRISGEMKSYGISMLPPDLTKANEDFILDNGGIRFGLSAIKGVADAALEKLRNFKSDDTNKFAFFESASQAGITIKVFTNLINAGALSSFGESRSRLVLEAQLWNLLTDKEKSYCLEHGGEYSYNLVDIVRNINEWVGVNGKNVARKTRLNTIKKTYDDFEKIYAQNSKVEELCAWIYEKELLGFPYSNSLKSIFAHSAKNLNNIQEIKEELTDKMGGTFIGSVDFIKSARAKNDKMYSKFTISDESSNITCFLFEPQRSELMIHMKKVLPKEGDIVAIKGVKSKDIMIIHDFSVQSNKVYLSKSDLKKDS